MLKKNTTILIASVIIIVLLAAIGFLFLVIAKIPNPARETGTGNTTLPALQGQTSRDQNLAARANNNQGTTIAPLARYDHVRGVRTAPITIIEFADLECPFCKEFHSVLQQIVTAYPGKVSWVYRHFPIDSLHTKARKEAEASECAAELGGNDKFWQYLDAIFFITPSNDGLDPQQLPRIAAQIGLNQQDFLACLDSGKYANKVASELSQALLAGGAGGTPYSVILVKGEKIPISGAVSYNQLKSAIDALLIELEKR
ncbi:MAG: thioredoxin domain-containing protein [Patescibacteria group bacterium]